VGAAFDFHAGLIPQAPGWMQRLGLEWAFRLSREPRRLWRRYLRYNPRFVASFARQYSRHLRRRR
jgi:N-acetylglucosaminyldiphosphoundecaprenol N-acetyl-beta-D-mannosaminyltransferase